MAFGVSMAAWAAQAPAQDAASGAATFARMCRACHALEPGKNKMGPSLAGVVGRRAGTVEGYEYSQALKESGVVWTVQTLAPYLADPRSFLPGNKMTFVGLKDEARIRDLIAHLEENAR
ncbi:cytochrome c family protein [Arenibaculum sp.]|uniref:c-type cytochrome n=1 Tax=Arenibaculum sp. TaxID=2865862 RepID=UPI002E1164FF